MMEISDSPGVYRRIRSSRLSGKASKVSRSTAERIEGRDMKLLLKTEVMTKLNSRNKELREERKGFMLLGLRVSTLDQNLELQTEALTKAGCKKIFEDKVSSSRTERPGYSKRRKHCATATLLWSGNLTGSAAASNIS
jgi:hypothetical protein